MSNGVDYKHKDKDKEVEIQLDNPKVEVETEHTISSAITRMKKPENVSETTGATDARDAETTLSNKNSGKPADSKKKESKVKEDNKPNESEVAQDSVDKDTAPADTETDISKPGYGSLDQEELDDSVENPLDSVPQEQQVPEGENYGNPITRNPNGREDLKKDDKKEEKKDDKKDEENPEDNKDEKSSEDKKEDGQPEDKKDVENKDSKETDKKGEEQSSPSKDGQKEPQQEQQPGAKGNKGTEKPNGSKGPNEPKGDTKPASNDPGNGYGALNKKRQAPKANPTDRARQNLKHQQAINGGNQGVKNEALEKSKEAMDKAKEKAKRAKEALDKKKKLAKAKKTADKAKKLKKLKALKVLLHSKVAIGVGIGFVIILIISLLFVAATPEVSGNKKKPAGMHCTYDLKGVTSSGTVSLTDLKVELINCHGTETDYTVLDTVEFEKYVLGVALAEIGPSAPDEALKAQIVAARNFALTRNSSMCPGSQDTCFYGYNQDTKVIRMRACENDQVYWDYTKDIYREAGEGGVAKYSPEVTTGTVWKTALSPEDVKRVVDIAADVKGKVLLDKDSKVLHTPYVNTVSEKFIAGAESGKKYDEILLEHYTEGNKFYSAACSSGNIDFGDYVISSDGHTIIDQPLDEFLKSKGTTLEALNKKIADNVDKAGYGTKAGVVMAAVTLIAELGNNYQVKVPYYYGGGHIPSEVVDGAIGYWGQHNRYDGSQCHNTFNDKTYDICGMDCTGFVAWSIKNGGFNIGPSNNFHLFKGAKKIPLTNYPVVGPGDILENDSHAILVIGIDNDKGVYLCAEASGLTSGVHFSEMIFDNPSYFGVKLDEWYEANRRQKE